MLSKVSMRLRTNVLSAKMPVLLLAATLVVLTLGPAPYASAAQLTLSPSTGPTGTTVTVDGSGFWPDTTGYVFFDQDFNRDRTTGYLCGTLSEYPCDPSISVTSESDGTFTTSLTIPPGKNVSFLGAGTYQIGAELPIGGDADAVAPFEVPANFTLSPNSGQSRTTVVVAGNKFAPYTLAGTQSSGPVWVDVRPNNFLIDPNEPQVQVHVLPDGSLSRCISSPCEISIPIPVILSSIPAIDIRVDLVHEADGTPTDKRSHAQEVEASAPFTAVGIGVEGIQPLTVTLSYAYCPPDITASVGLKAEAKGGLAIGSMTYSYYGRRGTQPSFTIQENSTTPTAWWAPLLPGYYTFGVTARRVQGRPVGRTVIAEANASTPTGCDIKKANAQVTLAVSPPSGQAVAPPQSAAGRLTLQATVAPVLPNATNQFVFTVASSTGGNPVTESIPTNAHSASWTPLNPPQPATPGVYLLRVWVGTYRTAPGGDVLVAEGEKTISGYLANAPPKGLPHVIPRIR